MPPTHQEMLHRYADVVLKAGLGLEPGQQLLILARLETAPLIRAIATQAYSAACRLVTVIWDDEQLDLQRLQNAPRDSLTESPAWILRGVADRLKQGDAYLQIAGNTPDLFNTQDTKAVSQVNTAKWKSYAPVMALQEANATNWCVASAATAGWAAKVFPDDTDEVALARLWEAIFRTCRLYDTDPAASWQRHLEALSARCQFLNKKQYSSLRYTGPGTDFTVGLPNSHIWLGGRLITPAGIPFVPNLPTEEVFTCPHRDTASGTISASRPLSYQGTMIEGITLTFRQGKVVQASSRTGEGVLQGLISTDQGSCRLGEVALVPTSSPISKSNLVFYNTLFDENASCHLALGDAYRSCVARGASMSAEEFEATGGNTSSVHVDFMIGSTELSIEGSLPSGSSESVIRGGEWAFAL